MVVTELLDQAITLLREFPDEVQDSAAAAIIQQINLRSDGEERGEADQD